MAEFLIKEEELTGLKGKVVIVTGGSSGIGLAAVELFLSLGASVISGDLNPPDEPPSTPSATFTFQKTDVTIWVDLIALFNQAKDLHGRIDHVFANAGTGPQANYLATDLDENGDLKEPTHALLDVSLKGAVKTATLAMCHMRQQLEGGSIVINGSSTPLGRLRAVDYGEYKVTPQIYLSSNKHTLSTPKVANHNLQCAPTVTAKGGILSLGRGLVPLLAAAAGNLPPIRVNTLAPTWTDSGVLPDLKGMMQRIEVELQPAAAVARAAALLMADGARHGQLVYVERGRYKEIDDAVLLPAEDGIRGVTTRLMMRCCGG
ncbi:Uu.00g113650.m01.CDS01 [Anthostomella pinea]|uniref:Uu.00g113650.m01.CDS01 n=1 Tax=Anthostomella pinea TaxID=933095 RepID=A0AAI8VG75_9PEZI|nr:Uu.00g113650.m01.CDS01 [Anthostomella pinea]